MDIIEIPNRIPTEKEISKWLDEGKVVVIGKERKMVVVSIKKLIRL